MISFNPQFSYNVDIIMCIDSTASMGPILDEVKRTALTLPKMFLDEMDKKGKYSSNVRFKIIGFRDFGVDTNAIVESEFFDKDETHKFENFVRDLEPIGGGDIPENALEALAYAMSSSWMKTGTRRRHVIILFTDAPALELAARRNCKHYPKDHLPTDLISLTEWWSGTSSEMQLRLDQLGKRLVIFAPLDRYPWNILTQNWECTIGNDIEFASGGKGIDMPSIISLLVNSI